MPPTDFPANRVRNIVQSIPGGTTVSVPTTIIPISGTVAAGIGAIYAQFAGPNAAVIDLDEVGASCNLALFMDGVGTGTITSQVYGLAVEDAAVPGTIVVDPHFILQATWAFFHTGDQPNPKTALGYPGGTNAQMCLDVTPKSSGVSEAESFGVVVQGFPTQALYLAAGIHIGRAGIMLPRIGRFQRVLHVVVCGSGVNKAFPKHQMSVVI